jgi:hypothetical protein
MRTTNEYRFYEHLNRKGYQSWITSPDGSGKDVCGVVVHSKDEDNHFCDLSETEQKKALTWIRANVIPRDTPLDGHTSYGMKHVLEDRTNIYMTNNQFKEAMLLCGFYPVEIDELNWRYCISRKSPIFKRQEDGRDGLLMPECVMEYPHAEWVYRHGAWECSNCGETGGDQECWYTPGYRPKLHQCPTCGAIMGDRDAVFPVREV